jgi:glutamate/tyrosine decarboxylase-like PLP-dependent enzyme
MAKIIDHLMELAQYARQKINNHPRLKLLSSQYLNNCFQVLPLDPHKNPNQFTLKVRTHLVQSGKALVNFVQRPDGLTFLRLVNANNQTSEKDLDHFFLELNKSITSIDKLEY